MSFQGLSEDVDGDGWVTKPLTGPSNEACRGGGVRRNRDIRPNLALSRKQYNIGVLSLWNANRNLYAIYRMVPFRMTFSELE